jgi:hypothetical protein
MVTGIEIAVRRDTSITKSGSTPAQVRRSGTKRAACSMTLPRELGLSYWLKSYKRAAPTGFQQQVFNRSRMV